MSGNQAFRAGLIRTLDDERPTGECMLVREGRVAAIGTKAEVEGMADGATRWVDLRPHTVLPGLTDSHIHLVEWALGLTGREVSGAGSMAGVLARVRAEAPAAEEGEWLEFRGWDPSWRSEADLTALDEASAGRPVALIAHDLHSGWLNSEAMRRLGIDADRREPVGGRVERDASGRPTGVLLERALDWWYQGRPRPGAAERRAALRRGQAALHRRGVTAVHSVEAPDSLRLVLELEAADELRLRVLHHVPQRFLDSLIECGLRSGFGSGWVRLGGIKYFTDGALGSRTAWMLEPYEGSRGRGVQRLDVEEFAADVSRAARAGLAATVHAIGDAAVRMTLDTLERTGNAGLAIPHRIEHLQCVHPDDLSRAGRLGIVASMQPSHMLTDISLAEERWGTERCRGVFALHSLLEAGTVLAFGSDAPVETADPREGFYAAATRRDRTGYPADGWYPHERITGLETLIAYTMGPARAAGDADRRGRLAPGFAADFAAWETDPVEADPDAVLSADTAATVVGGEIVFSRD
ncbi:MAG: amidohydrolase [Gemmatimonadetes bacterium]|uniref:Amidohydrolase n=1 Tax=Candidatus Kutchimonas denitrificans TaxID=3056748 RepID=A0AAE4Z806_9BACT|nr:amidohydrolase [Gemmatimonadota bacterium]NIR75368.1 amidohydrolase [Candidatus Kutchimonas denitrificans]NIS01010.1 amidohydrolase [Gemmatimonadota bacterium]NIT66634.1 amidohydrolase [Gemmatimonadota bacterium]NIU53214.1 amidohydrolase family protein [Gemmatimonadota bacterium]